MTSIPTTQDASVVRCVVERALLVLRAAEGLENKQTVRRVGKHVEESGAVAEPPSEGGQRETPRS